MESSRAQWSDARLDDLSGRVTELDHRLTARIDTLESRMDGRFNSLDAKFDGLQRTMILSMTSVVLAFAAQIVFGS
jgi:flagellar capping protein FliD